LFVFPDFQVALPPTDEAIRSKGLRATNCLPTPKFERGRMLELPLKPLLHIAFVV